MRLKMHKNIFLAFDKLLLYIHYVTKTIHFTLISVVVTILIVLDLLI